MLRDPNNMLNQRGKPMGIEFVHHDGARVFNSYMAHKLIFYASKQGTGAEAAAQQNKLVEIYFRKYFKEGLNLGLPAELIAGCVEAGLDAKACEAVIAQDDDDMDEIVQEELVESHSKATGVPYFQFGGGGIISGGESVPSFMAALKRAK